MVENPVLPVIRSGIAISPLPLVAAALIGAGLPAESAAKFADVAVEAVRLWLWGPVGKNEECVCDLSYAGRELEDPQCRAHEYDLMLGGDGNGLRSTAAMRREQVAAAAARIRDQLGEELYSESFAPIFAEQLEQINRQEGDGMGTVAVR